MSSERNNLPRLGISRASDVRTTDGDTIESRLVAIKEKVSILAQRQEVDLGNGLMPIAEAIPVLVSRLNNLSANDVLAKAKTSFAPDISSEGEVFVRQEGDNVYVGLKVNVKNTDSPATRVNTTVTTSKLKRIAAQGYAPSFTLKSTDFPILISTGMTSVYRGNLIEFTSEVNVPVGESKTYVQPPLRPTSTIDVESENQLEFNERISARIERIAQENSELYRQKFSGTEDIQVVGSGIEAAVAACLSSCQRNASSIKKIEEMLDKLASDQANCGGRCPE